LEFAEIAAVQVEVVKEELNVLKRSLQRFAVLVCLSVEGELISYCCVVLMARELDCAPVPLRYVV
jgi:hypothetical protein